MVSDKTQENNFHLKKKKFNSKTWRGTIEGIQTVREKDKKSKNRILFVDSPSLLSEIFPKKLNFSNP